MQVIKKSLIGLLCAVPAFCYSETITLDNNNGETIAYPVDSAIHTKWNGESFIFGWRKVAAVGFFRLKNTEAISELFSMLDKKTREKNPIATKLALDCQKIFYFNQKIHQVTLDI